MNISVKLNRLICKIKHTELEESGQHNKQKIDLVNVKLKLLNGQQTKKRLKSLLNNTN